MILLVTDKKDVHPNPVLNHLAATGYPVFRLNTDALLTDYEFAWTVTGGLPDFFIRNTRTQAIVRGHEVNSLWERRPSSPGEIPFATPDPKVEKFVLDEARGFVFDLRHYLGDRYALGHPLFDCHSDSKMWQLKTAHELGMAIPDTVISNRKNNFVEFADRLDGGLLVKPLNSDSAHDFDAGTEQVFYSRRITRRQIEEAPEASLSQTACCMQEYIPKKYELRVTVVHDRIFSCKIDSQAQGEEEGMIDWRQGYDFGIRHEPIATPESIRSFCLAYLRRMHLNFGCFDFILTPDGRYVFLECNPNGQWLWIEKETGLPISEAIAEVLMQADRRQLAYNNNSCY